MPKPEDSLSAIAADIAEAKSYGLLDKRMDAAWSSLLSHLAAESKRIDAVEGQLRQLKVQQEKEEAYQAEQREQSNA